MYIIDADKTEAPGIPAGPLNIVHRAPDEITAQVYALFRSIKSGAEVVPEKLDPLRVVTAHTVLTQFIPKGTAVFRDVERELLPDKP
jgi:hypothetical protein